MPKYVAARSFRDALKGRQLFTKGDPFEPESAERAERLVAQGFIVAVGSEPTGGIAPEGESLQPTQSTETTDDVVDFDKFTVPELREFAAENDIDLTATKKADIITEILASLSDAGTATDDGE